MKMIWRRKRKEGKEVHQEWEGMKGCKEEKESKKRIWSRIERKGKI